MESPCRFVRFVVPVPHEGTSLATGLFQIRTLWHRRQVPLSVRRHVDEAFDWYGEHLPVPPVVKRRKDGICWFRREPGQPWTQDAHEPLRRAFVLAGFLRAHGVRVETVQVSDPGTVIYEDRWQVVAVPAWTTPTGRVGTGRVIVVV